MPGVWLARSLVRKRKKRTSVVTAGSPKTIRHLPHNGVTVSFVLAPETGLVVSVPGATRKRRHQVDLSVGRSGPHDFAVRKPHHSSVDAATSIASRTNVRDDRETPLLIGHGTRGNLPVICPSSQVNGLRQIGTTGKSVDHGKGCQARLSSRDAAIARALLPGAQTQRDASWPGVAVRRKASLALAYVPAIHVFCDQTKKVRRGCAGRARA